MVFIILFSRNNFLYTVLLIKAPFLLVSDTSSAQHERACGFISKCDASVQFKLFWGESSFFFNCFDFIG